MANEKKMVPGIDVGDRVKVTRPGFKTMTGKVVRNDEMSCEIDRDDIPMNCEFENPRGYKNALHVKRSPCKIHLFGTGNSDIMVEKIA